MPKRNRNRKDPGKKPPPKRKKDANGPNPPSTNESNEPNETSTSTKAQVPIAPVPAAILGGLTRSQTKAIEARPPSPNKQTRSMRKSASNVPLQFNYNERKRIAELIAEFEGHDFYPCSIFGQYRNQLFRQFKFCGNCKDADEQEKDRPGIPLNRKTINGRWTCRAKHQNSGYPTTRKPEPPKVYRKKQRIKHSNPTEIPPTPPSRRQPSPPPTESPMVCVPIEEPPPPTRNRDTSSNTPNHPKDDTIFDTSDEDTNNSV